MARKFTPVKSLPAYTRVQGGPEVHISDIVTCVQHLYRVAQKFTPVTLLPAFNTYTGWPKSLHQRHYHPHSTCVQSGPKVYTSNIITLTQHTYRVAQKFTPTTLSPAFNTCTRCPQIYTSDIITCVQHMYRVAQKFTKVKHAII